jgi:hypothetical protein
MKKNISDPIMLCVALLSLLVHKNTLAQNKPHFHSHVHGVSELTIAIEEKSLEIEIKYPAMDVLGFEHKVKTVKDKEIAENVKIILNQHGDLFSFTNSECLLKDKQLDMSSIDNIKNTEHEEHNSEEIKHHEVIASYYYHCQEAPTLSTITINVFDHFSAIHQINTRWLTEEQQGSIILSPTNRVIKLR